MSEVPNDQPLQAVSNMIELKPDKQYLLVLNGATVAQANDIMQRLTARGLKNLVVLYGDDVQVLEAQPARAQGWRRYRFSTGSIGDPRPLVFDPHYPWWHSGSGDGFATIVAYLPEGTNLYQYWPDAFDINSTLEDKIEFTDRFPMPGYFVEET